MRIQRYGLVRGGCLAVFLCAVAALAHAQGVLTLSRGSTVSTMAGTGVFGYSGDGGIATSATLASPSAVAYDVFGNIYIADARNHVIRKIAAALSTSAGPVITTVAGSGEQGFSGDGGPATKARLDTPTGIAVNILGILYIADSHNHRIRMVDESGKITTIAGTGAASFGGDGGPASKAQLSLPSGVAVDDGNNLYVTDTNNQRIRRIGKDGTITTFAGNGQQSYGGDGGAATAASLDSPVSVAVDRVGNVYIADRHNHCIRRVDTGGTISTLAGRADIDRFAGGFAGDGGNATEAALSRPGGVAVDRDGSVYVADTNNHRIRQVANGVIATVAGNGKQMFAGDNGSATGASLDTPQAVAIGFYNRNIAIVDRGNQRVRSILPGPLSFGKQMIGGIRVLQSVTLSNSGNAPLQVQQAAFSGPFEIAMQDCSTSLPITIAAGGSCTVDIAFSPVVAGSASGKVVFSGSGFAPQTLQLEGTGTLAVTATSLTSDLKFAYLGTPVTFTANVYAVISGIPTGKVEFVDSQFGTIYTATLDSTGKAIFKTDSLPHATYQMVARYLGDNSYSSSTSAAVQVEIVDAGFLISTPSGGGTGSGGSGSSSGSGGTGGSEVPTQVITSGQAAKFGFTIQAQGAPMQVPVVFSAQGLPAGATATFNPPSITPGLTPSAFAMTIQTPKPATTSHLRGVGAAPFAFGVLLLPLAAGRRNRRATLLRMTLICLLLLSVVGGIGIMTSCGSVQDGFMANPPKDYTITVVGTATNSAGTTMQRIATVKLTVK
jgi:sugar lactone lactonase YvrE